MRKVAGISLAVLFWIAFASLGLAQSTDPISGEWLVTRVVFGNQAYQKITSSSRMAK